MIPMSLVKIPNKGQSLTVNSLIIINCFCALLHFAFEYYLLNYQGIYREFLLIENLLIGFVFVSFSAGLYFGSEPVRQTLLNYQLAWWSVFVVLVIAFWDAVTTLSMFKQWFTLPLSESSVLLTTGLLSVFLCIHNRLHTYYAAR